ncbi:DUF6239 family natural product biosynthesis protein [Amycolatopsis anabasis]|uniref:DUF6239 family natural product biosynthesis protein n=1 Tax=Amycolatopsis anabasis TaxID=1840409 RepID=UPI00131D7549|nr:DUF6239 family natural product biosynthesis protein [Amycolatopsis anabasis]
MLGGHDHVLSVPVSIGPLVLRIALLSAVPVVAGFAIMRVFQLESSRATKFGVAAVAGIAVVLELLLAGGLDLPEQAVVPLLAALAGPLYLLRSQDPRFRVAVGRTRRAAPWVVSVTAVAAAVEFGRAWFGGRESNAALLHTGIVLALVALSWFVLCQPRSRAVRVLVRGQAVVLAVAITGVTPTLLAP